MRTASAMAGASRTANKAGILKPSKFAAAAAPLNEPLIPKAERQPEDEFEDNASGSSEGMLPKNLSQKDLLSAVGVGVLAVAGMAASLAAIVAVPASAAVILMGGVCLLNAPVAGKQQLDLAKSAGLRNTVNDIREETGYLKIEVDFVQMTVNELQAEADALQEVESKLQAIADEQGSNANALVELVNENQSILDQMKKNLKQSFAAGVASIVMRSDIDGDMKIDMKELPLLSMRLRMHLEELGVELDVGMFEDMVREDNDISNVLKFCADVLYAEEEEDDDDGSVNSELTFDLEAFADTLDEEGNLTGHKMTKKERRTMIRPTDKYSKGSVEVARGGRPSFSRQASGGDRRSLRKTKVKAVKKRQTQMRSKKDSRKTRMTLGGLVLIRGTAAEI